jgi:hypothetical protein
MEKKKYLIYIDESNISAVVGNSVYCAILIFYCDRDRIGEEILYLENKLNINYLHWVDMPWKLRIRFGEEIRKFDFMCNVIIYKNPIKQDSILEDFLPKIFDINKDVYKITIDGKKNNKYIHKLNNKLKNRGVNFNKIIFTDDKNEVLIRLADFMAGLIRSYVDSKNRNNTYIFNLLKHKIKIPS